MYKSSKFVIPINGPEGHTTDNTATYAFIIKTHIVNSEIIAFVYYCDLRIFAQIAIFVIAKHEILQYKWILMIPKFEF